MKLSQRTPQEASRLSKQVKKKSALMREPTSQPSRPKFLTDEELIEDAVLEQILEEDIAATGAATSAASGGVAPEPSDSKEHQVLSTMWQQWSAAAEVGADILLDRAAALAVVPLGRGHPYELSLVSTPVIIDDEQLRNVIFVHWLDPSSRQGREVRIDENGRGFIPLEFQGRSLLVLRLCTLQSEFALPKQRALTEPLSQTA